MKIALFGANGEVGKRIAAEALDREHDVLAVVRNPAVARLDDRAMVTAGNATFARMVQDVVDGVDAVVSAIGPRKAPPSMLVKAAAGLMEGMEGAGVKRLVVVGCAGVSVSPPVEESVNGSVPEPGAGEGKGGTVTADAARSTRPHGPAKPEPSTPVSPQATGSGLVAAHAEVLAMLGSSPGELSWTWVVPLSPCTGGERSGSYESAVGELASLGTHPLGGEAALTLEDLAVAIVDELERNQFQRQAMTVAGS